MLMGMCRLWSKAGQRSFNTPHPALPSVRVRNHLLLLGACAPCPSNPQQPSRYRQPSHCQSLTTKVLQVATRRTRTAGKVEIPNVDDHVSKLEHMGKETVKKLQDLRGAAMQVGLEVNVPDNCINKGAPHACMLVVSLQASLVVQEGWHMKAPDLM